MWSRRQILYLRHFCGFPQLHDIDVARLTQAISQKEPFLIQISKVSVWLTSFLEKSRSVGLPSKGTQWELIDFESEKHLLTADKAHWVISHSVCLCPEINSNKTGAAVVTHSAEPFKDTHWLYSFIHKSLSGRALFEVTLASFVLRARWSIGIFYYSESFQCIQHSF